jgi:MYXO-CTERM domain-containing protein
MKRLLPALAIVASAAVGTSASAASSTTYFSGFGGLAESYEFNHADGTKITATASAWDPKKKQNHDAHVGQYLTGLGVSNSVYEKQTRRGTVLKSNDGSHQVDGKGFNDTLWLSFDHDFNVMGIKFSYVGKWDDVRIVDGDHNFLGSYDLGDRGNKWGFAYLDLSSLDLTTTKIGLTAVGDYDAFKVKGIHGMKTEVVPTPSAAAAGLLGLAALTARRRRREEEKAAA